MIVEDDLVIRNLLADQCGEFGYETVVAEDGEVALAKLAEHKPDIIITDIKMPNLDGIELLKKVKDTPSLMDIPVLMVSAFDSTQQIALCLELGAEDLLSKPIVLELLKARLKGCLDKRIMQHRLLALEKTQLTESLAKQMVGAINHNFNQPLTVLRAGLDIQRRVLSTLRAYTDSLSSSDLSPGEGAEAFWSDSPYSSYAGLVEEAEATNDSSNRALQRISQLIEQAEGMIRLRSEAYVGEERILDLIGSGKFTVLIAEDDSHLLQIYIQRLQASGYHVISATNGIEAKRHIDFSLPHIAILDGSMPNPEGLREILRMKRSGEINTPIILFSSSAKMNLYLPVDSDSTVDARIEKTEASAVREVEEKTAELLAQHYPAHGAASLNRAIVARQQAEGERDHMELKLRQAEKMQAIGELCSGVAHDFNNQLAAILGYCELIRATNPSGDTLFEYVDIIEESADRSAELTRQLLAFSRSGPRANQRIDVHELINKLDAMLGHVMDKRIIRTIDLAATQAEVRGDESELQNALLNLCNNAGDAMDLGGELFLGTTNVEWKQKDCDLLPYDFFPGTYLTITIRDTGCGMPAKTVAHIFEPFFTTKEKGKGTGLGLASVYGTVKSCGGRIEVESIPREGTTFTIELPLWYDDTEQ